MKKLASLGLASALALSVAAPALAASGDVTGGTSMDAGTTTLPTVNVVVPGTSKVILNPYQMKTKIDGGLVADSYFAIDSIVSQPVTIENKGNIAVRLDASFKATKTGAVTYVGEPWTDAEEPTKNQVHAWLEVQKGSNPSFETAYNEEKTNQILFTEKSVTTAVKKTGIVEKLDVNETASFKISGKAAKSPDQAWSLADTIGAQVAWTFVPLESEAELNEEVIAGGAVTLAGTLSAHDFEIDASNHTVKVKVEGSGATADTGDAITFTLYAPNGGALTNTKDKTYTSDWSTVKANAKAEMQVKMTATNASGTVTWAGTYGTDDLQDTNKNTFQAWKLDQTAQNWTITVEYAQAST